MFPTDSDDASGTTAGLRSTWPHISHSPRRTGPSRGTADKEQESWADLCAGSRPRQRFRRVTSLRACPARGSRPLFPAARQTSPKAGRTVDARTAGSSFLWSAVSLSSSKLLVFLVTLVMARLLVPQDFGVVAVGLAIVAFLEVALDLGVGSALIYEQERGITRRVQTAFTVNLGIAVACTVCGRGRRPPRRGNLPRQGHQPAPGALSLLPAEGARPGSRRGAAPRPGVPPRAGVDVTRAVTRGVVAIPLAMAGAGPWALVVGILATNRWASP